MMKIGMTYLKIGKFIAKISNSNASSIHLFTVKLEFEFESHSDIFKEVTLVKHVDQNYSNKIDSILGMIELRTVDSI